MAKYQNKCCKSKSNKRGTGKVSKLTIRKRSGPVKKRTGLIKKRSGPVIKRSGPLKKRSGSAMKRSGSVKKRSGSAMKRSGSAKTRSGPVWKRQGSSAKKSRSGKRTTSGKSCNGLTSLPGIGPAFIEKLRCNGVRTPAALKCLARKHTRAQFARWLKCEPRANRTQVNLLCRYVREDLIKSSARTKVAAGNAAVASTDAPAATVQPVAEKTKVSETQAPNVTSQ